MADEGSVREVSADPSSGRIRIGDCLRIMQAFDDRSVDITHLDPPFDSNRICRARPGEDGRRSGLSGYLDHR